MSVARQIMSKFTICIGEIGIDYTCKSIRIVFVWFIGRVCLVERCLVDICLNDVKYRTAIQDVISVQNIGVRITEI